MTQTVLIGELVEKGWLTYGDGNYSSKYPKASELLEYGEIPFISGKNLIDGRISHEGMRYIRPDLHAQLKKGHIKSRDTLLVTRAGVGEVAYVSPDFEDANINAQIVFLRPDGINISHNYLYQLLSSDLMKKRLISHSSGSAQGQLPIKSLLSVKIDLPDIKTQDKIADVLGAIDEKIELNRKMNETLEQMGQALFRHYFITNPEAEKWEEVNFAEITEVVTGKGSVKSQMSEAGKVPLYGSNGIMGTSQHSLYDEPVIITGRVGTLGKVRAVTGAAWYSDNVLIMKPKAGFFSYVLHIAKSFDYISMNRGSSQPLITQTDLRNRKVSLPDEKTLSVFESQYADLFKQKTRNDEQINTLTTLRDILLPKLISGKIKVWSDMAKTDELQRFDVYYNLKEVS